MSELIFLKLGGSLITDKHCEATAREDTIRRLAQEISQAQAARPELQLLLGHGSGSFGHFAGQKYATHLGLTGGGGWEGYAQTSAAAARLNRIVTDSFLTEGVPIVSLQPSASAWCRNGKLLSLELRPIRQLLQAGLIPLVYGDVALDEVRGFTIISTETIFAYLAPHFSPDRIILVGMVDGVYTADPLRDPGAHFLPQITSSNIADVERLLGGSHGIDVTGGMLSKVRTMFELVRLQHTNRVQILSGSQNGLLFQALTSPQAPMGTIIQMA